MRYTQYQILSTVSQWRLTVGPMGRNTQRPPHSWWSVVRPKQDNLPHLSDLSRSIAGVSPEAKPMSVWERQLSPASVPTPVPCHHKESDEG